MFRGALTGKKFAHILRAIVHQNHFCLVTPADRGFHYSRFFPLLHRNPLIIKSSPAFSIKRPLFTPALRFSSYHKRWIRSLIENCEAKIFSR